MIEHSFFFSANWKYNAKTVHDFFFPQKLAFDQESDGSQFSDDSGPKIQVKTRHPSGDKDQGQQQETRVVESKRRSFIVSRVTEQPVIPDQIKEDETEEQPTSDNFVSPDLQTVAPSTSTANLPGQAHTYETDLANVSDNEKSLKSREKGRARVDISDLEEKLTKLTGGGVPAHLGGSMPALDILTPSQLGGEPHSPVPSDDGLTNSQTFPQMTPQNHPGIDTGGSQHQHTAAPHPPQQQADQTHLTAQPAVSQIHTRSSETPQPAPPPQTSFPGQPAPQPLSSQPPPQPAQPASIVPQNMMVPGTVPQVPGQVPTQLPMQPQEPVAPANFPTQNMYPGYPYMHMMPSPMFMPPQMMPGYMPMYPHDQISFMNPQVPFVMVNVQQQNQISQMLVPANMVMTGQYPMMQQGPQQPSAQETKQSSSESLTGSPPSSPPHQRKQNSMDSQAGEGVVTSEAQSPLPNRSNYSIASLEQELIKKLHGNRRDIQIPSGASAANLNESFQHVPDPTKVADEKVNWSLSSDSVHSTELAEAAKRISERDKAIVEDEILDETDSRTQEDKTEVPNDKGPVKKLRFSVSKVVDDPLKETLDESKIADVVPMDIKESEKDTELQDDIKLPKRSSRFQVTKVQEVSPDSKVSSVDAKVSTSDLETKTSQDNSEVVGEISKELAKLDTDAVDGDGANPASADLTIDKDKPYVSNLLDIDNPYRKKSMSFYDGYSAAISNNTFNAFSNSVFDRYQIYHRRRTRSLGHLPSMQNAISKHTQYGDGETPLPSPSPSPADLDLDDDIYRAIFNLDSFDCESDMLSDSAISDPESKPDSDYPTSTTSYTGKRRKLQRQFRKVKTYYPF